MRWDIGEPCMCGGCRQCLHDQGQHCGDEMCWRCEPLEDESEPEEIEAEP